MNKTDTSFCHICKGRSTKAALLTILILLAPITGLADRDMQDDFTLKVKLKRELSISIRDLPKYFHVVSVRSDKGEPADLNESIGLGKGDRIKVKVRKDLDVLEFARPLYATTCAPVYLDRKVEIKSIQGRDLAGKQGVIQIPKKGLGLRVEERGILGRLDRGSKYLNMAINVVFDDDIIAHTEKTVSARSFRKETFKVLNQWVSSGDAVRIKIPMPDTTKQKFRLAVGFWTGHSGSGSEEKAYLADITGIEPEKVGGKACIIKARVPPLSALENVRPPWFCPYPARVKMTVTAKLDENNIISETLDLQVMRRAWGLVSGLIFLAILFGLITHLTRDFNPFDKRTTSFKNWEDQYKSNLIKRFFFSPLDFAVTPIGSYSISVAQVVFWTFLIAFSCVYVYVLNSVFLMIPNQILILMGISGCTALISRINAASRDIPVPKEIMKDVQSKGIPRLRDMIFIGGRIDIYKFQMAVFTLITGTIVLVELIKGYNFPVINNSLIALMGLSNALYLGNEITTNPLKKIRQKIKGYNKEKNASKVSP